MKRPAFQFYPGDWLSSTAITLMTPAEEGGYIRLLAHSWMQTDCGLPDDDEQLAVLSRLGKSWKNSAARMRKQFVARDGRLYNPRLMEIREAADNWYEKQKLSGKAGAKKRWGSHSDPIASPLASPLGSAPPKHSSSSSSSSSEERGVVIPPDDFADWADAVCLRHPRPKDRTLALHALVELASTPDFDRAAFDGIHLAWCQTAAWRDKNGIFAPTLGAWIGDQGYRKLPLPDVATGRSATNSNDAWAAELDRETEDSE